MMEASLRCPRESVDDARSSNESSLASSVALPSSSCPRLSLYEARVAFQLERVERVERVERWNGAQEVQCEDVRCHGLRCHGLKSHSLRSHVSCVRTQFLWSQVLNTFICQFVWVRLFR